jgi:hypothetical protein
MDIVMPTVTIDGITLGTMDGTDMIIGRTVFGMAIVFGIAREAVGT